MKRKTKIFLAIMLIPIITGANVFAQEKVLSEKEKQSLIKAYYDTAIRSFQANDFSKAISYWEQILKLDPTQVQPPKLIEFAKQKLMEKYSKVLKSVEESYNAGRYTDALSNMKTALETSPNNTELKKLYGKIRKIQEAFGDETAQTKNGKLIRFAVREYIKPSAKFKTALHSIIYAGQLNPSDGRIEKFVNVIEEEYPNQLKAVEVVPGMTLVEQKLVASLNYIYDAKYDRAIVECNSVLELEPSNAMAMKRLGSAYYALNKKSKAIQVWREAFKLNPKDDELKSFLSQ
ncbi:MAG: hypothetical protein A2252_01255 [Elusimicrobia bacterium RIFOXYA2_FULL_39_19]|nr:MAG: hypothetical protein A2252_01255 [Elusimicrobia bacterium RIFOXYA2_FULL_39_19]